jgi:hypothetical protein
LKSNTNISPSFKALNDGEKFKTNFTAISAPNRAQKLVKNLQEDWCKT